MEQFRTMEDILATEKPKRIALVARSSRFRGGYTGDEQPTALYSDEIGCSVLKRAIIVATQAGIETDIFIRAVTSASPVRGIRDYIREKCDMAIIATDCPCCPTPLTHDMGDMQELEETLGKSVYLMFPKEMEAKWLERAMWSEEAIKAKKYLIV